MGLVIDVLFYSVLRSGTFHKITTPRTTLPQQRRVGVKDNSPGVFVSPATAVLMRWNTSILIVMTTKHINGGESIVGSNYDHSACEHKECLHVNLKTNRPLYFHPDPRKIAVAFPNKGQ